MQRFGYVPCLKVFLPNNLQGIDTRKISTGHSPDILLEYEEVLQRKYNVTTANTFIALLKELPNVQFYTPFYNWRLINADPDDDKYTDCAIAGSANFIVTEDKHFAILKKIAFPKITVLSIDEFVHLITS